MFILADHKHKGVLSETETLTLLGQLNVNVPEKHAKQKFKVTVKGALIITAKCKQMLYILNFQIF